MDDYLGRRVVLKSEHRNRGGDVFAAGEELRVYSHHRGRLYLGDLKSGAHRAIKGIDLRDVELVNTP